MRDPGRRFVVAPSLHPLAMGSKQNSQKDAESTVDDPLEQREDDAARERSTSPVPRVGDTWESMRNEPDRNGPQRRVGVLVVDDDGKGVLVEDKVTRRKSHIAVDRFEPPHWRFIG